MVNPTDTISQSTERYEHEPALRDTRIFIFDDNVRRHLMARLAEYQRSWPVDAGTSPRERVRKGGPAILPKLFEEMILETVMTIEGDAERDFTVHPIVITEVSLAVQEATGLPVVSAAIVPFKFSGEARAYAPDPKRREEATPVVGAFLDAYMVIKTNAGDRNFRIEGIEELLDEPSVPSKNTYLGWD